MALLIVAVIFARLPYMNYTGDRLVFTPLQIDMSNLDFAGERLPIDPHMNPFGREKIEQELLITHFSLYQFLLYHKYAADYFPYMDSYFHEIDIPDDFKYLAVAESGLRNDVVSRTGAAGVWQLMPDTARRYGLRVDDEIDERLNFERATRAA
jgi:membrane-bound lytic murein transglycosylase D